MNPTRVMIVDDDEALLRTLGKLLIRWGYEPVLFAGFEEARAWLLENPPEALVVDVRLGMYNGLQLAHLARRDSPATVVVALSGFDDPVLRAEAEQAGAPYLVKPVDPANLRSYLPAA
jgi:DNA-binding response OmpR family regulator